MNFKNILKILKRILFGILLLPIIYGIFSIITTYVIIEVDEVDETNSNFIFLTTNGVHLDLVLPIEELSLELKKGLDIAGNTKYIAFGWGDKDFYINTPSWEDLTFKNAMKALFYKSETLMHLTQFSSPESDWVKIKVSKEQLQKMNLYLDHSFEKENAKKVLLAGKGYGFRDAFYKAKGSYSCFKTCNSWVNTALKDSNLKHCLWTPYSFRLMEIYK